jgi:thiol-activated cytolysin
MGPMGLMGLMGLGMVGCDGLAGRPGTSGFGREEPGGKDDDAREDEDGFDTDVPGDTDGDTDGEDALTPEDEAINDYIYGLGTPWLPAAEEHAGPKGPPKQNGDYTCTETNLLETKQYDKIVAFAANSHTMYPGSIVGGNSIQTGLFVPKVLPRAPIRISASLEGVLDGDVSATLEEPSMSAYRDAMDHILSANLVGNTPANMTFDIEEVYSQQQMSMAMGLDIEWISGNFGASFDWNQQETNSRFVINFMQSYYTVDVDVPSFPSDYFREDVTLDDVKTVIGVDPPAYVASVTYGRLVSFTVESKFSAEETRAALEFGFNAWTVDVDGHFSLTNSEILNEIKMHAFILGGNGSAAVQSVEGVDGLRAFIQTGGSYSHESQGAPIAYKLAYLADNTPARFSLTTDYTITECDRVSQNIRVALSHLQVTSSYEDSQALELYGTVDVRDDMGTLYPLFDRPVNNAVHIFQGNQWPESGEVASWIIPVRPQPGENITLVNNLWDRDSGSDDLLLGGTLQRKFEDGWRGEWVVPFASAHQKGNLVLELKPVP